MKPAIAIERLSKCYHLGAGPSNYLTFRETLSRAGRALWPRRRSALVAGVSSVGNQDPLWALRDLSFDIEHGEVLGVIGRNGAGKSTLLKVLSRITEPTAGRVTVRGRLGSLLEVGTGFHPELTGRENIYMNGSLLGMSGREIARKFDEIVAFSEIAKFLDTPVKRYSSGMYVRLAFAVAAHLEPEILVVDEVLAVGDAAFQQKCLGKISEVGRAGRTVLFVSHNMAAVRHLCTSAILLDQGRIDTVGDSDIVIAKYLQALTTAGSSGTSCLSHNEQFGVTFKGIELLDGAGNAVPAMQTGQPIHFRIALETSIPYGDVMATIGVHSLVDDVRICMFNSWVSGNELRLTPPGTIIHCTVPNVPLPPGNYRLTMTIKTGNTVIFYFPAVLEVAVVEGDYYGTGRLAGTSWCGLCLVHHAWGYASLQSERA